MVTISCAFRYSVSGRSTGTLISTGAPDWSKPETRSVSRGSPGFGTIRGAGALAIGFMPAQYDIPDWADISTIDDVSIGLKSDGGVRHEGDWRGGMERRRQDHAAGAADPVFHRAGPAGLGDQACPSQF